jgi:hypothetical protein
MVCVVVSVLYNGFFIYWFLKIVYSTLQQGGHHGSKFKLYLKYSILLFFYINSQQPNGQKV